MEVKNVYQDESGKWQIEYSYANLMGLTLRVFAGYFLIFVCFVLPFYILIAILISITSAKSIPEQPNISAPSNSDVSREFICK